MCATHPADAGHGCISEAALLLSRCGFFVFSGKLLFCRFQSLTFLSVVQQLVAFFGVFAGGGELVILPPPPSSSRMLTCILKQQRESILRRSKV